MATIWTQNLYFSSFAVKTRTLLSYLTKIVGHNENCIKIHISLKHRPSIMGLADIYLLPQVFSIEGVLPFFANVTNAFNKCQCPEM
jgi:hypothetical protein